jgi:alkaline phosphatase D
VRRFKTLHRRDALKLGAAALGGFALPLGCEPGEQPWILDRPIDPSIYDGGEEVAADPEGLPVDEAVFDLGVQAGAVRAGSVLLWTHVPSGQTVNVTVFRPGATADRWVVAFTGEGTPNNGGYIQVRATGLAPGTWYSYVFDDGSGRSLTGRFQTAFPIGARTPLTVGAMTCTHWEQRPWVAAERIAQEEPQLLLHLGDMGYFDGSDTLNDYRELWRDVLDDPGYRAVLPTAAMYATWDDHEITNDLNPETVDPELVATAKQAYFEALPQERQTDGQIWKSFRWGDTAEFFVMDCRTERRPSTREDADATYISDEQMAWLKQALTDSPCHFKVMLNSVPATLFTSDFWALQGDRWQGYFAQREELLSFITDADITNVWFLAGDFHLGFVTRLEPDGPRRNMYEIAVGPTGPRVSNPLAFLLTIDSEDTEVVFPPNQFLYARGGIAATMLTFDPIRDGVRVRYIEPGTDEVLFDEFLRQGE